MTASSAPTAAVSSSGTLISSSVPLAGAGISVSTLSVDTSSSGSSACTSSPTCLSQRVTVPSVTLSPSRGMVTDTGISMTPVRSAVYVQGLAGEREVRLAQRLGLGRVHVDELRDVRRVRLPVVDELGLADQLADPGPHHVASDDRPVLGAYQLHEAVRP